MLECELKYEHNEDTIKNEVSSENATQPIVGSKQLKKSKPKDQQKNFQCDVCVKSFHKECYLETHKKKVHGVVNKQTCEFCNKDFEKKSKLALHIKSIHEKSFSVVCDLCGKSFTHPRTLKKHRKSVHEGVKEH